MPPPLLGFLLHAIFIQSRFLSRTISSLKYRDKIAPPGAHFLHLAILVGWAEMVEGPRSVRYFVRVEVKKIMEERWETGRE